MAEVGDTGLVLGLLAGGLASGLVPVVNAEALLTGATASRSDLWLALAASITLGQCAAKSLIYLTAREGPRRLRPTRTVGRLVGRLVGRVRAGRDRPVGGACSWAAARRRADGLLAQLGHPGRGTSVVLLSASVGMPPLAAVSVMAGAARLRLPLFVAACLAGRLARFVVIAWPVAHLVT